MPANRARLLVPLAGLALLAVLFVQLGASRILWLLETIGWNFPIILAIFGCHESVRALALGRCLRSGQRLPFPRLLAVRFLGESVRSLTHTGPFLSEPARGWMLARQGLDGAHAYAAAVAELMANSTISSFVSAAILAFVLRTLELSRPLTILAHVLFWVSIGGVVLVVAALSTRAYLIEAIVKRVSALPVIGRRVRVDPAKVRQMEDAIRYVLRDHPKTMAQVVLLELTAQAILVFEVFWSIRSMGVPISPGRALLVEALTKLANAMQMIGATEGAYAVVFNWLGMTAAVGFTLSLVKRVRSLTVAALGLGVLALLGRSSSTHADGHGRQPATPPSAP